MDETYAFKFSLYKDDLVKATAKGKETCFGYFDGCDRASGNLNIEAPDSSQYWKGVGARNLEYIKKYQVDPLGRYVEVKSEPRLPLNAKKGKS